MIAVGPDGVEHEFPDGTSNDVVDKVMKQNYGSTSGSGIPSIPGSGQPAPTVPAQPPPQQTPIDPSHFTASGSIGDTLRSLNQGVSGGLWNPIVAGTKSLISGDPYKDTLAAENLKSAQASQVSPSSNLAMEGLGAVVGPSKLSQVENAARLTANPVSRLLIRGTGGAAEGGAYAGVNAAANQQDTWSATGKGAAVGGPLSVATPMATGIVQHLAKQLPDSLTGAVTPDVPTSADLRAGSGFKPADTYRKADVLDDLQEMQRKANVAKGPSLGDQTSNYLLNQDNWNNLSDAERTAMNNVAKAGPISQIGVAHPNFIGHSLGDVPGVLGVESLMHGEPLQAAAGLGLGLGTHLAAYTIPPRMLKSAQQSAFDEAQRVVGGTPSTPGPVQGWLNNPNINKNLQAILFGQNLQNQ
jgi:hypothetical protein